MNQRLLLPSLLLLTGLLFSGCTVTPTIRGSGTVVTESRDVSGFREVSVGGSGSVLITQGDDESLQIEADDNLLPYIRSEVHGQRLEIWHEGGNLRFSRGPVYTLQVRELEDLRLSGSLNAKIEQLETPEFRARISGSGSVRLGHLTTSEMHGRVSGSGHIEISEGRADAMEMTVSGSGDIRTGGFEVRDVDITISGSGGARVWATESLDAHVSGSGSIRYKGRPEVSSSISGSGSVRAGG